MSSPTKQRLGARVISTMLIAAGPAGAAGEAPLAIDALQCEYRQDPIGVDTAQPRLGWRFAPGDLRGQRQTAYQVLVASTPERLAKDEGDLWDSGKVSSDQSIQLYYAGKPLAPAQRCFWKVRTWNQDGLPSTWSSPASWTMGLLQPLDWQGAKWIGAAAENGGASNPTLLLRREFPVKSGLRRAVVFVSGLGHYELSLNGAKVGDDLLAPGWTNYRKTCLYDSYDVTSMLREGPNAAGIFLGNGLYRIARGGRYVKFEGAFGPQQAIVQLRLEYEDGTSQTVVTDADWRTAPGPITFENAYGGEDFDARLDPHGWNRSGFDASKWTAAKATDGPGGQLRGLSAAAPPIRPFDVLKPVKVTPLREGVTIYDLGQNASLMPRLKVRGPAGAVVRMHPAELLRGDGSIDQTSSGRGPSYWQYTLAGGATEEWFPRFFYRGCRYLQVELIPASSGAELPTVESLEGVVVHSSSTPAGEFSCSNELFTRIHTLVRWAQRSNMMSYMTDCPHREKLSWLEEGYLNGPALRYNFDLGQLFTKLMNDMADSQLDIGMIPSTAPEMTVFGKGDTNPFRNSPEWGSAFVMVPWQQYEFHGDIELLRRHYQGMQRYVDYLAGKSKEHILDFGLGDWYDIGPKEPGYSQLTPRALTATAIYFADVEVVAKTARLLGHEADAKRYEALAAEIAAAFNAKFYDAQKKTYATGSQTANAIPLVMNLVPPQDRQAVLDAIVKDIRDRGNALTSGDVGYRYLLRALADGGRSDVIFDMNSRSDKPGYGMQLAKGATSLTEAWDARPSSSQNHFMLGQITEWFYHDLAGIRSDATAPGFKKVIFRPVVVGDITWVKASYESPYGKIVSNWRHEGGRFTLDVTLPPNASGTVYVPAASAEVVTESTAAAAKAPGVQFVRMEDGAAVFVIESGRYSFSAPMP